MEAAHFFDVRLDSIRSWDCGRRMVPERIIDGLRNLYATIERHAAALLAAIDEGADVVELRLAHTDGEAASYGLPCVGAHQAVIALVAARAVKPVALCRDPLPAQSTVLAE